MKVLYQAHVEAIHFTQTLPRLLCTIFCDNPWVGPILMSKTDIAERIHEGLDLSRGPPAAHFFCFGSLNPQQLTLIPSNRICG